VLELLTPFTLLVEELTASGAAQRTGEPISRLSASLVSTSREASLNKAELVFAAARIWLLTALKPAPRRPPKTEPRSELPSRLHGVKGGLETSVRAGRGARRFRGETS
jgi:hypothetical protein